MRPYMVYDRRRRLSNHRMGCCSRVGHLGRLGNIVTWFGATRSVRSSLHYHRRPSPNIPGSIARPTLAHTACIRLRRRALPSSKLILALYLHERDRTRATLIRIGERYCAHTLDSATLRRTPPMASMSRSPRVDLADRRETSAVGTCHTSVLRSPVAGVCPAPLDSIRPLCFRPAIYLNHFSCQLAADRAPVRALLAHLCYRQHSLRISRSPALRPCLMGHIFVRAHARQLRGHRLRSALKFVRSLSRHIKRLRIHSLTI